MKNAEGHAKSIWMAAVEAAKSQSLLPQYLKVTSDEIQLPNQEYKLSEISGVLVLGFGKAAAEMAATTERLLMPITKVGKTLRGLVNAPCKEGGSLEALEYIEVHGARAAGLNRPTEAAVEGTGRILKLAASAKADELILVVISGGGSALSPAPVPGISLADKLTVTRFLNEEVGAPIEELNCVRRALSRIKGGGLARACSGKAVHGLILSDVMSDDLSVISSGPLEPYKDEREKALATISRYDSERKHCPESVYMYLQSDHALDVQESKAPIFRDIIGNNATAIAAAKGKASLEGLRVIENHYWPEQSAGIADSLTRFLIGGEAAGSVLVGGGEPHVFLPANHGKGGRNQQLILEVIARLSAYEIDSDFCVLSAGTDGEDGPTDAAGGFVTSTVLQSIGEKRLSLEQAIVTASAYDFLLESGGLFKTGLTGTNVCDIWVVVKL
jgi:hydroxypyruvate reductase